MNISARKIERAFSFAKVFKGDATRAHILKNMAEDEKVLSTLSAKQLTAVINVANRSYHDGKSSGVSVEDDCLWIGLGVDKLIPINALKALEIKKEYERIPREPTTIPWDRSTHTTWTIRTYTLNFKERF